MKQQPAKVNYFFGECYEDLFGTIKTAFKKLGETLATKWEHLCDVWGDLRDDFGFWRLILTLIKTAFYIASILATIIFTSSLVIVLSVLHIVILAVVMAAIYLWFSFLWLLDTIMSKFRQIVSSCPKCQRKFALPYYQCPGCGREHTKLKPSKYGILKRKCNCGRKIPTTFLNGRQKLQAKCPACNFPLAGGGFLVNVSVPVIGGPSSGKTCYINMAMQELENIADTELGFDYEHIEQGTDDLKLNLSNMKKGQLPSKTTEMKLRYYEFFFSPKKSKVRNQISLCDVGGEVYNSSQGLNEQIGYKYANAYLMIIDPLSIKSFKDELEKTESVKDYNGSNMPIDEILALLIKTIENMENLSAKDKIDKNLAIVFTKCDMPLIMDKVGDAAVAELVANNAKMTKFEARNTLCEQFLAEYDETGFINTVKSKFNHVQYFTCSALGHNVNGEAFVSTGVAEPILWLIDKQSRTLDFKTYWSSHN